MTLRAGCFHATINGRIFCHAGPAGAPSERKKVPFLLKRLLALLAALVMMTGCACAQGVASAPIATYSLPRGAEALHLWDTGMWEMPEGLEEMYYLMQTAQLMGDVYLIRMPHGRALVSVSCMKPDQAHTAQEMLAMWPQIAENIAKEGAMVNADERCASVAERYGFEALQIRTEITVGEWDNGLLLDAEGAAFMRGDELLEVWAVAPEEGLYAADDPAAAELAADREAMAQFLDSLSFSGLDSMAVEGVPYTDPEGRFALVIPAGSTVLTKAASAEEIDRARQAYLDAHEEGADRLFDEYISDMLTQNVTLIIAQDQQIVAEIFASQEESFRDVTVEQLLSLAYPIQQSLAEKFDAVLPLQADQTAVISGQKHAWLTYWLRTGEANAQLDVLASVLEDAWLYEVDLYAHDGDQEQRMLWYTLLTQTLRYTPLVNALD